MMMWRRSFAILIVTIIGALATESLLVTAVADPRTRPGESRRLPNERLLRGVLTIYIWKMTEAVKLNEEQSARVFPLVRKNFQTRWQLAMERRNLIQLFRKAVDATPQPEAELTHLLEQWGENEKKIHSAREGLRISLTKVLSPEQQAKSLLFEEEFESELARAVMQIRQENSQRVPGQNRGGER